MKKKIGILGGTFDPFHNGHMAVLESSKNLAELDEIILMPANVQPFKIGKRITSKYDRLNMLKLIEEENGDITVSDLEIKADKITYTYNTIKEIKDSMNVEVTFIMGGDSLLSIEKWYKSEELLKICDFAVAYRPGFNYDELLNKKRQLEEKYERTITLLDNIPVSISSTEIRQMVSENKDISKLVPHNIKEYIEEHGLYKD